MARGEFDNLAGKGKPIDLDAYFNTSEDVRMAYSILKSNNFVPQEVELLREMADLKTQTAECPNDDERLELSRLLRDKSLALALILEKSKKRR